MCEFVGNGIFCSGFGVVCVSEIPAVSLKWRNARKSNGKLCFLDDSILRGDMEFIMDSWVECPSAFSGV